MIPIDPDVGNIADEISNIVIDHLKEIGLDVPEPTMQTQTCHRLNQRTQGR